MVEIDGRILMPGDEITDFTSLGVSTVEVAWPRPSPRRPRIPAPRQPFSSPGAGAGRSERDWTGWARRRWRRSQGSSARCSTASRRARWRRACGWRATSGVTSLRRATSSSDTSPPKRATSTVSPSTPPSRASSDTSAPHPPARVRSHSRASVRHVRLPAALTRGAARGGAAQLAFEGATRRHRPMLNIGSLVYCMVPPPAPRAAPRRPAHACKNPPTTPHRPPQASGARVRWRKRRATRSQR